MLNYTKWVACWGNATSIKDQTEGMYAKDLTLRYPIDLCFSGSHLRFHFSNLTGTEAVVFTANVASTTDGRTILPSTLQKITVGGSEEIRLEPGQAELMSDPVLFPAKAGDRIAVSLYLGSFTQLNAAVLVKGPLSTGFYTYGNYADKAVLPSELTWKTNWFYYLNTVDIFTEQENRALVCFGDSITAQDWPDYLTLRCRAEEHDHVSIIRRAVCGTRILRQYDCVRYAAYGLKGETRFPIELNVAGADTVLIQHGINDIIHPVGSDVNEFRPMSDLPTAEEMIRGYREFYINKARDLGLSVWGGTLLPIYGWRTYADFREILKNDFNSWLRATDELDGCVDFDRAICDPYDPRKFADGCDAGDHLHPSALGYKRMAECVPEILLQPAATD